MRTRLTLLSAGALTRDIEVRAPAGTPLSAVRSVIAAQTGPFQPSDTTMWAGSRTLPDSAQIGGPGLRSGSVVGVGGPGPRHDHSNSVLRLHVVCGPDAGLLVGLPRGLVTVGRAPDCDVRLTDTDVSRQHLELAISTRGVSVRDLSSTNGARLLSDDGSAEQVIDSDGCDLPTGRYVRLGESIVCVAVIMLPAAATFMADDGGLIVNRPPRLTAELPTRQVMFDPPSRLNDRPGLPWLAAVLPAIAGVGLAWFMHNPQFLAFALLSPLLMFSTSIGDRLTGRRGRKRERTRAREQLNARRREVLELATSETRFRRNAHPDPAALLHTAVTPDSRIWERRRNDSDFLSIRLGLADRDATLTVRRGSESVEAPRLAAVPLVADLQSGPLGIFGPRQLTLAAARWSLGQIAALHSPTDVSVVAIVADDDASTWSWLRWLPHRSPATQRAEAAALEIAHTEEQRLTAMTRLLAEMSHRSGPENRGERRWHGPWIVVLVDRAARHASLPGIGRLLEHGAAVGITAICVDDERRRLPPACTSVAELTGDAGTRIRLQTTAGEDAAALTDRVNRTWAERLSRALSPLRDLTDDAAGSLPGSVRLLDLIGGGLDPRAVNERWEKTRVHGSTRSILGLAASGPFEIDLERDGPHTLIAGTTGAGKSELLQTFVAGLAVNCSPTDLQFVLIDYKGGAAFADCARLPHTTGLVTDLDGHLTERALRSLDAELSRRETLFADARTTDLTAYRLAEQHQQDPIGRLVLVVDEFAALAEELPDFVNGLIAIAQRGRSL
ncbi:MAG: cell division-related protein, partial [Pseudonocardiales bacterium]|nr:cell division-related protein [Pseudonocardiales bacterium]